MNLKFKIVAFLLRLSRVFARKVQIGNPDLRAPKTTVSPGNEDEVFRLGNVEKVSVWNLKKVFCNAFFGGVVISKNNQVFERFTRFPWGSSLHPAFTSPFLGRKTKNLGKVIFLITPEARGNFYHWMIDLLPRLLLIKKSNLQDFSERHIILHDLQKPYEKDTLELLDIPEDRIVRITNFEIIKAEDLIIADYYSSEKHFPLWKKQLLQEFKEDVLTPLASEKRCEKIYLLRGNQRKRRLIGESRLVKVLEEAGFAILDPQKLTLFEQINCLDGAEIVISLHGAALTNIIFCKEQTQILELRSTINSPEHFSHLARSCNLRFDSIKIAPEQFRKKRHHANKQNLILTKEKIDKIFIKIKEFDSQKENC